MIAGSRLNLTPGVLLFSQRQRRNKKKDRGIRVTTGQPSSIIAVTTDRRGVALGAATAGSTDPSIQQLKHGGNSTRAVLLTPGKKSTGISAGPQ